MATVSPQSGVFFCGWIENNVMRKRMPRWCDFLRKAPSSVKSAGVHVVLSWYGMVSDLRGRRRKSFVSVSASQLRCSKKCLQNQLDIALF